MGNAEYSREKDMLHNSYCLKTVYCILLFKEHSGTKKVSQDLNMASAVIFLKYLLYYNTFDVCERELHCFSLFLVCCVYEWV